MNADELGIVIEVGNSDEDELEVKIKEKSSGVTLVEVQATRNGRAVSVRVFEEVVSVFDWELNWIGGKKPPEIMEP